MLDEIHCKNQGGGNNSITVCIKNLKVVAVNAIVERLELKILFFTFVTAIGNAPRNLCSMYGSCL